MVGSINRPGTARVRARGEFSARHPRDVGLYATMSDAFLEMQKLVPAQADALRALRLEALQESPEAFGSTLERERTEPPELFAECLGRNGAFGPFQGGAVFSLRDGKKAGG
jgi:hypothetical protein